MRLRLVLFALALPAAARSQAAAPPLPPALGSRAALIRTLAPGDLVRVTAAAGRYQGTVERVTPDTLVVTAPGRSDAIPRAEVRRLDRFIGRSPRGRAILLGAGGGLVGGTLLGLAASHRVGSDCGDLDGCDPSERDGVIQGALVAEGAVIGALVGAMVGPAFRRTHWENAAEAFPVAAGLAPGGGIAARVVLKF